jgi:hypothetical protein
MKIFYHRLRRWNLENYWKVKHKNISQTYGKEIIIQQDLREGEIF